MILAIDEGTTNTKVSLFDESLHIKRIKRSRINSYFPRVGWHEQDPDEIFIKTKKLIADLRNDNIKAVGITNQRETTILWSAEGGKPLYNAIVWQCRRTAEIIENMRDYGEMIKDKTGLNMDAYFSASKIKWLLEHIPNVEEKIKNKKLKFGTVDSYLIWKLTDGVHATDITNASRTMLFNIRRGEWDDELLEIFRIPEDILPQVKDSDAYFGDANILGRRVPITGVIGDQQSSLFGQGCINRGDTKITYGTGAFILMNLGNEIKMDKNILTTIAWGIDGNVNYALEGSIFSSGMAVEWLKKMNLWKEEDLEDLESELYFVPAFSGLGAPYWDQFARALLIGITPDVDGRHITKALLESVAYMVRDVIGIMENHSPIGGIRADGGMTDNDYLMQFQADVLQKNIRVSKFREITSLGAAMMSSIGSGINGLDDLKHMAVEMKKYTPRMHKNVMNKKYRIWKRAVKKSFNWARDFSQ